MLDLFYCDNGHCFTSLELIILNSTFMHCSQLSEHLKARIINKIQQFIPFITSTYIHTYIHTYTVCKHHLGTMKHSCSSAYTHDTWKFSEFLILMQFNCFWAHPWVWLSLWAWVCLGYHALIYNVISSPAILLLFPHFPNALTLFFWISSLLFSTLPLYGLFQWRLILSHNSISLLLSK